MRTPSSIGRVLFAVSVLFAAAIAIGGAFFVGYVGEVQRGLSDPPAPSAQSAAATAALERALGYDGFLRSYRSYRLTGEPARRAELNRNVADAEGALNALKKLHGEAAAEALRDIVSIAGVFAHVATTAPAISTDVLRGTAAMDDLNALPQPPQLEATYLSLRNALDTLRRADERRALGGVSSALSWSQGLIVASLALTAFLALVGAYLARTHVAEARPDEQRPFDAASTGVDGFARRISSDVSFATQSLKNTVADLARQQAEGVETTRAALQQEVESLRGEIRDLAVRLAEDRILDAAGPTFAPKGEGIELKPRTAQRTLADVPADEIMTRLKNLAVEMSEAQDTLDQVAALKNALGAFSAEIKHLSNGREQPLTAIGAALHHHADEIEAHAGAIEPNATALRTEVRSITDELRRIAARAESGAAKDNSALRVAAVELGARAESLFTYLEQTHPDDEEADHPSPPAADETATDIAALSDLIARLETRARDLSERAVAARFADLPDDWSPTEREQKWKQADIRTDAAIKSLFESINRLNNVAAALARAGDAERHRRTAH